MYITILSLYPYLLVKRNREKKGKNIKSIKINEKGNYVSFLTLT